jgi:hypothetical protein
MSRLRKAVIGLATAMILGAGSVSAQAQLFWSKEITIGHDRGGRLLEYATFLDKASRQGRSMRFAGHCQSACTLYLAMPRSQMCILPGASFSFHLPHGASARVNAIAANYMMRKYPNWVREWIDRNGGLTNRMKRMDYAYASRFIDRCENRGPFALLWAGS